jgi:putative endonuclease
MRRPYAEETRGWRAERHAPITPSLQRARAAKAAGDERGGMTYARQRLGRAAEDLVAARLENSGWRIVARNVRLPSGELDVVAMDRSILVFVEVKAGRAGANLGPEMPAHAVGRRKQLKLRRLAREWIGERRGPSGVAGYRFDVVGVRFGPDGLADVDHIRNAF